MTKCGDDAAKICDTFYSTIEAVTASFVVVFFMLIVIVWFGLFMLFLTRSLGGDARVALAHSVVFGLVGALFAYLTHITKNSFVSGLIAQIVAAAVIILQVASRMLSSLEVPIGDRASVSGAATAAFSYIFTHLAFISVPILRAFVQ